MLLTGIAALILALAHLAGAFTRSESIRLRSFAGGVGTAYVFLIVLPLLSSWQDAARDEMDADRVVFLVALAGLSAYYVLDLWSTGLDRRNKGHKAAWVHTGGFALYSLAVGFVLADYSDRGIVWLAAYTGVIGLHFHMNARSTASEEHHPLLGKGVLAGAVLLGWLIAQLVPHSYRVGSFLFAAMAGAMILNILKDELPGHKSGVPSLFMLGVACIALLSFALRI